MSNKKDILIIDDEQVILDAVTKICRAEGWEVDAVLRAGEALKKLSKTQYSLILCDIMMPEIDGYALINILRSKKIDIPVIMITGYSTVENAVESLHNGAVDFIPKPFTYEEITSTLQRAMAFRRIKINITNSGSTKDIRQVYYISCPPDYKRLGYWSWVKIENEGTAKIGATDLFIKTIDGINKIDLMPVEDLVIQGSACAQITTNDDLNHNFLSSLSGRIVKRNEELIENPVLLEKDPHKAGWLYKIIPSDIDYEMKYLSSCNSDSI